MEIRITETMNTQRVINTPMINGSAPVVKYIITSLKYVEDSPTE